MSREKIKLAFETALIAALDVKEGVDAATMGVARAYLKDTEEPRAPGTPARPKSANESIIADAFMAHAKGLPFGSAKQ